MIYITLTTLFQTSGVEMQQQAAGVFRAVPAMAAEAEEQHEGGGGGPINYEQWREIAERKRVEDRRRASDEHRRRMEGRQVLLSYL